MWVNWMVRNSQSSLSIVKVCTPGAGYALKGLRSKAYLRRFDRPSELLTTSSPTTPGAPCCVGVKCSSSYRCRLEGVVPVTVEVLLSTDPPMLGTRAQ